MRKRGSTLGSSSSTEDPGSEEAASSDRPSRSEAASRGSRGVAPHHVVIGRLGRPNGLEGFIGIYVEEEDIVHLQPDNLVFIEDEPYTVRALRRGKKGYQIAFVEVTTRDAAEAIRGNDVVVAERRQLSESEYWPEDLVGLEVRPGGGMVVAVSHGAAQDRLVIERSGAKFEVPFVDELVPVVDVAGGYVEVVEMEGLSSPTDQE